MQAMGVDRQVLIGDRLLGVGLPPLVQTMYDQSLPHSEEALDELVRRIGSLNAMGCDIIRFSYPKSDDRSAFTYLCARSPIPVVADIHFDYKLALEAIECGAHKIRINPGNIGARWKVDEVLASAKDHGTAIRIGLNSGSLPKGNDPPARLMSNTALTYLDWFEQAGFTDSVVSLKASDEAVTIEANRLFALRLPLHLRGHAGRFGRLLLWYARHGPSDSSSARIGSTGGSRSRPIETEVQAGVECSGHWG